MEAGYRGSWSRLRWDVSLFHLQYNNRLGSLSQTDPTDGSFYIYRTNIGNSYTNGAEVFAEYNFTLSKVIGLSLFTSTSFFNARYQDASVRSGEDNINVSGNRIEGVPEWISRNGMTFRYRDLSLSFLYSHTGESYADAINTAAASSTGTVGLVPSYGLMDVNASLRLSNQVIVRINVNNLLDEHYFTKRPSFYPGPGVWSSDGRSINCTVAIKI